MRPGRKKGRKPTSSLLGIFPIPVEASDAPDVGGELRDTDADCPPKYVPRIKCSRSASTRDRQEYLDDLRTSIAERADPELKRPRLDPQNSGEGEDLVAANRDVDLATKDQLHTRIHNWEQRASIKRACTFDELSRSCKASRKEMRSILNICDIGNSG